MTRINFSIDPEELCDFHLLAEHHELPRLFNKTFKGTPPPRFKLGAGHVLWCVQYPRMLADRFAALVAEFDHRGFKTQYRTTPEYARQSTLAAPACEVARARPLLIERITERLSTAKREPRWTRREPPTWAYACGRLGANHELHPQL